MNATTTERELNTPDSFGLGPITTNLKDALLPLPSIPSACALYQFVSRNITHLCIPHQSFHSDRLHFPARRRTWSCSEPGPPNESRVPTQSAQCQPARNQIETTTQDRRRLHAKRTPFIWLAAMCSRTSHSTPAVSVTVSGAACFTRVPIEISSDTHRAQSASLASHHERPSLYLSKLTTVRPSMSDRMWSAASSTVDVLCLAAV